MDDNDKYPFWVNRVGALLTIAEGLVQLFTPWLPSWSLSFYCWWLDRAADKRDELEGHRHA